MMTHTASERSVSKNALSRRTSSKGGESDMKRQVSHESDEPADEKEKSPPAKEGKDGKLLAPKGDIRRRSSLKGSAEEKSETHVIATKLPEAKASAVPPRRASHAGQENISANSPRL